MLRITVTFSFSETYKLINKNITVLCSVEYKRTNLLKKKEISSSSSGLLEIIYMSITGLFQ